MKGKQIIKNILSAACVLLCIVGILGVGRGLLRTARYSVQRVVVRYVQEMYMPSFIYVEEEPELGAAQWGKKQAYALIPLFQYMEDSGGGEAVMEDEETIARILENQANDENRIDEEGNLVGNKEPSDIAAAAGQVASPIDMSIEKLRDFNYLLNTFYTVDGTTMIGAEQLNADELLGKSMKINQETEGPKVLIFHTHSQEEFADSTPGDPSTSIVGIGEYLTECLNGNGIPTIHDSGVYDIIDGTLDRSSAYENAEASIRPILEQNPSIEVVIDLHRDGVAEGMHLVTEVNGKQTARIMYFNGLSRTRTNGDIAYLYNPYIQDNLAFSLQMELKSESLYPGFARHIYLGGYRYNLHLLSKSLLIEAGAQTNTVEEMKNAMEVLAETLTRVLTE